MLQNLENEIWVPVVNYDGYYTVSNLGRIQSVERIVISSAGKRRCFKSATKRTHKNHNGYIRVQLSKNGINKEFFLHRLILSSFKGEDPERKFVNHINGVRDDNRVENLEWVTPKENTRHSFDVLGRKPPVMAYKKGKAHVHYGKGDMKPQCKRISCDTLGIEFVSIRKAARELGLNNANICSALRGRCLHTEGFTFRYI